ncbi:hypothetical protein [Pseudomonas sp. LB3P58]
MAKQTPIIQPRLAVDCLMSGLLILKAYKPDMEIYPCHRSGRAVQIQEVEFEKLASADRSQLLELGWWNNDALVWCF